VNKINNRLINATLPQSLENVKRPMSIWLVQVLFILVLFRFALSLGSWGKFANEVLRSTNAPGHYFPDILKFTVEVAVAAFLVSASIAIAARKRAGRWMGLLGLTLIFALSIFEEITPHVSVYAYDNDAQRLGAVLAGIIGFVGIALLFWRFGFSQPARRFFNNPVSK
jgi:hypothetical protein